MMEKNLLFKLPIYCDSKERGWVEGYLVIFNDRIEVRKVFQPNINLKFNEIEFIGGTYSVIRDKLIKQHNGLATAANILNMADYTLSGQSIGYSHQGYATEKPYISHYQEILRIIPKNGVPRSIKYSMSNKSGDLEFSGKIEDRIAQIDKLNSIVKPILEENKENDFDDWYEKNVSIKPKREKSVQKNNPDKKQ